MALPALAAKFYASTYSYFGPLRLNSHPPTRKGKHSIIAYINGCIWMQLHGYIVGFC